MKTSLNIRKETSNTIRISNVTIRKLSKYSQRIQEYNLRKNGSIYKELGLGLDAKK
jgi:hypothetical protein